MARRRTRCCWCSTRATARTRVRQAEQFHQAIGVTGLVVTKLDGTAKGGVVVAIARRFGLPIRFIGIGEQAEDFGNFDARAYVEGLLRPAAAETA